MLAKSLRTPSLSPLPLLLRLDFLGAEEEGGVPFFIHNEDGLLGLAVGVGDTEGLAAGGLEGEKACGEGKLVPIEGDGHTTRELTEGIGDGMLGTVGLDMPDLLDHSRFLYSEAAMAAVRVFCMSMVMVMGPTPPGTGVM